MHAEDGARGGLRGTRFAWRDLSRSRIRPAVLVSLLVVSFPTQATTHDPGAWLVASAGDTLPIGSDSGRWRYLVDAQARYFDFGDAGDQFLIRPAIGYRLGKTLTGWFGYARFQTTNSAGIVTDEDRPWQQLDWTAGQWRGGTLSLRTRLEQRFVNTGDDMALVLRLYAKYVRPFGERGQTDLILATESFFDLRHTDWGGASGIGQGRVYAGLGKRLSDKWSLEIGYMNQLFFSDNVEDRDYHLAVLNFKYRP